MYLRINVILANFIVFHKLSFKFIIHYVKTIFLCQTQTPIMIFFITVSESPLGANPAPFLLSYFSEPSSFCKSDQIDVLVKRAGIMIDAVYPRKSRSCFWSTIMRVGSADGFKHNINVHTRSAILRIVAIHFHHPS